MIRLKETHQHAAEFEGSQQGLHACYEGLSSQQQASKGGRKSPGEGTGCRFLLSGIS